MPQEPLTNRDSAAPQPFGILDFADYRPDADLDALVQVAALVCGTPISLISLMGTDRQWFKAQVGLEGVQSTSREVSFCAHAIQQNELFEVHDATMDWRFSKNPTVTADPNIRFYAGAPLVMHNGVRAGALCVVDTKPRILNAKQKQILTHLAQVAVTMLESKRAAWTSAIAAAEYRTLTDALPVGIFATDKAGRDVHVNPKFREFFGLEPNESLDAGWAKRLHPEDRDAAMAQWQAAVDRGEDFEIELRLLMDDASIRTVRSLSRPVRGPEGKITGHVGSVEDITQRLALQRKLDEKHARLTAILDATGAATYEWNVQTGEIVLTENWARIMGYAPDDFKKITLDTSIAQQHPDDRPRVIEALRRYFANPVGGFEVELRKMHAQGHWVSVLNRGNISTFTADGKPEWMFGVQIDITSQKRQEEALRKSESLLSKTGEVAGVGGWDFDLVNNTLIWTEQTCRIHGLPVDFKPDMAQSISFYAPNSRPVILAAVETAVTTGEPWDIELQLVRPDGSLIWVRAVGQAEFDGPTPIRLFGAFQDITDRVVQLRAALDEQKRIILATDSGGIGIWEWRQSSGILAWDRQMFRLYGYPEVPDIGAEQVWQSAVHPDDVAEVEATLARAMQNGERFDAEFRILWPDGSQRTIRAMSDTSDDIDIGRRLNGVNWDVTEIRAMATDLAEQHRMIHVTLRSIGDAVITTDGTGIVTWLNPVAELMTGWPSAEACGRPLAQIFNILNEATLLPVQSPVDACLAKRAIVGMAAGTILVSREGQKYGIEDSAAPIKDDDGNIHGVVLVFHDVTAERRLSGEMTYRATHDPLTGAKNRTEFERLLEQALETAKTTDIKSSLLFIDLDQFKLVNDACGHAAGDEVLQRASAIFAGAIRSGDRLARLGGDEFGIILEDCPVPAAERIAQTICEKMAAYRYTQGERSFRVGASIGLVPIDARWISPAALLRAADAACISAKETGRNRCVVWRENEAFLQAREGEKQWVSRLEHALSADLFQLYGQPIIALGSGATGKHLEVLLRLPGEAGEMILPGAFMPSVERFNLSTRVDLWVLGKAVAFLKGLPDLSDLATVSINLSGKSVGDRAFHRQVTLLLQEAGPDICQRLSLEVTETAAFANIADASLFIEQVHALGVRVALDDFGAGATSFGHLKSLKVDCLKIDGQFVQSLLTDPLSQVAVRSFVDIARVLRVPTVAEFVDHPDLLAAVGDLGIDYAQGYLLGKPVPLASLWSKAPR